LLDGSGAPIALSAPDDAIRAAARRLADGAVLAMKGIGGYHLACDAANGIAVAELRTRKRREDRPFALMVRDMAAADELVELGEVERTLLVWLARWRPACPSSG
jgi:hydrogenase maturation protein HypF